MAMNGARATKLWLPSLVGILLAAVVTQLAFRAEAQRAGSQRSPAGETRSAADHHEITESQLPRPFVSHSAVNPPQIVPQPAGAQLKSSRPIRGHHLGGGRLCRAALAGAGPQWRCVRG